MTHVFMGACIIDSCTIMLASKHVGGRSLAAELPSFTVWLIYGKLEVICSFLGLLDLLPWRVVGRSVRQHL